MINNVILIPYRNRKEHLDYFINNTIPLLTKYLNNFKVLVIEQMDNKPFNKGKLLNVGFIEYKDKCKYFISHDVDINPSRDIIINLYNQDFSVLGIYNSKWGTLGGIVKISSEDIYKVNGFTNEYYGWGCEDKNLQNRVEFFNIPIKKNILSDDPKRYEYFTIFDNVSDRDMSQLKNKTDFEYNLFNRLSDEDKYINIMKSGLNNVEYIIEERISINEYVEIIKVRI